ncbi:hypothetical protein HPB49_004574 [Dermacentor silvarum]|uniref:Uncharacterized protein n=1 Tax=Dermacentor silvarum TaxID=543639 RepID=A0ACB8CJA3_DERSI|nr:hypothetical protein HPB49_004574 [Dermacentor silvarum]
MRFRYYTTKRSSYHQRWNPASGNCIDRDLLHNNGTQNATIISSPILENAKNYSSINEIQINQRKYVVTTYITPPENTYKGVIHGIPQYAIPEDIERSLVNQRNLNILHARDGRERRYTQRLVQIQVKIRFKVNGWIQTKGPFWIDTEDGKRSRHLSGLLWWPG